jgi:hypothetical protein
MTIASAAPRRYPGRLLLFLGLGLAILGVVGYVVQIALQRLVTPWYLPGLATLGVVLLVASLWQALTVWRVLALIPIMLLAGATWAFLLMTRLPAYGGPVKAEDPFPAFVTKRADDMTFTERHLEGKQNNVLVFFRGRW